MAWKKNRDPNKESSMYVKCRSCVNGKVIELKAATKGNNGGTAVTSTTCGACGGSGWRSP